VREWEREREKERVGERERRIEIILKENIDEPRNGSTNIVNVDNCGSIIGKYKINNNFFL
jgi:hypothetical protein